MPELPEVEVLVRHLRPLLVGKTIRSVRVRRAKVLLPTSVAQLGRTLRGARFTAVARRGKFLVFTLRRRRTGAISLLGHLGMTGRMYLAPAGAVEPKHAAVVLELGREKFIFEDTRYFGRLTLATGALARLGPEPLGKYFSARSLAQALGDSRQAIKVKLLDQSVLAGVGNIYASEALFHARLAPSVPAGQLTRLEVRRLWRALRSVLRQAILRGSTVPLNFSGSAKSRRPEREARLNLFYYGANQDTPLTYEERLRVYDREGKPCVRCGRAVRRIVQAARSTFFCPQCQRGPRTPAARLKP
jgi:formamidopyrimidine-DNA glycosylase